MYYPVLNQAIVAYLRSSNETHEQFAKRLHMTDCTLRNKRMGQTSFTIEEAMALCILLKSPMGLLFGVQKDGLANMNDYPLPRGRKKKSRKRGGVFSGGQPDAE